MILLQPLEQFSINLLYYWGFIEITNFLVFLFIIIIIIFFFFLFPLFFYRVIPNKIQQSLLEIFKFALNLFRQQTGNYTAMRYFPLIFCIFIIILISNILGLVPFGFTITSHVYVTAFFSISLFLGITFIGFINNQFSFFNFFIPKGIDNRGLLYYLVCIEVFSYLIRPLSLGIRLFANMLAGHTLLFILSGFVIKIPKKSIIFLVFLPLLVIILVVFLEIAIALIQAYVFTILLSIYINDIYNIGNH